MNDYVIQITTKGGQSTLMVGPVVASPDFVPPTQRELAMRLHGLVGFMLEQLVDGPPPSSIVRPGNVGPRLLPRG